ncbi:Hermansky-Pudlak syndrome 4 protein [Mizuhopecten yessoensis]|uniref:Hermansky-Pudlak syndrome 4 protein n=2 Tax=Mizuhopecten yessoensis TaxID=6573 RepID=A0A210PUR9_MIZYE|nr:Hermansky-Pudlak syndrome 4 protein [Mizuhopecten yessoensis]
MSPELTRKLVLIRPELPCAEMKTDFPLPVGVRLITIYVTDEEYSAIKPQHSQNSQGQYRHCDHSKFVWGKASPDYDCSKKSESPRRFTKDESNIRRPSSRNDRNYSGRNSNMEIIPEIPSSVLSDITYVECKEKLKTSEKSNETETIEVFKQNVKPKGRTECRSVKGELPGRKIVVTVSGEDSETISDLEDNEDETLPNVSPNKDKNFVKFFSERISADIIVHHCPDQSDGSTVDNTSEKLPKIVTDHDSTSNAHVAMETENHLHTINILPEQQGQIRNQTENNESDVVIEKSGRSVSPVDHSKGHNSPGVSRRQSAGFVSESEETGTESVYGISAKSCDESVMSYLSSQEIEENKETMVFRGSNYETPGEESSVDGGVTDQGNPANEPGDVTVDTPDTSIETVHNSGSFESQTTRSTVDADVDSSLIWSPEKHGLHELTLYIQRHSDVCLMLLMEEESAINENALKALYKSSLTNMAELDYYVKECIAQSPNEGFMDSYNFLKYDSFFQTVKGNALQPLTGEDDEFHRLAGQMHSDFEENKGMTNVIFRSHGGSCYGNKTINNETYFCMTNQADSRMESGPLSKDPVFSLDLLAREKLSKVHKITLL